MPYEITQCYLPPGRGDFPAFTPAEAGTRFSDPGGMQGWVDLVGGLSLLDTTVTAKFLRNNNRTWLYDMWRLMITVTYICHLLDQTALHKNAN